MLISKELSDELLYDLKRDDLFFWETKLGRSEFDITKSSLCSDWDDSSEIAPRLHLFRALTNAVALGDTFP
jgi:hypothetical protein